MRLFAYCRSAGGARRLRLTRALPVSAQPPARLPAVFSAAQRGRGTAPPPSLAAASHSVFQHLHARMMMLAGARDVAERLQITDLLGEQHAAQVIHFMLDRPAQ
jgi:hypothetical protein